VRIALLSPYSWTYPGGVTRHIDALARELSAAGHEARVLAPYDPDDELSVRLHRGARPQPAPTPPGFVSLGRTVGIPANGAVSNLALTPTAVWRMRNELRAGGYDVVHLHEPVAPTLCWDALMSLGSQPLVGTFHTYSENGLTNGIAAVGLGGRRRMNRLHARIAVSEAAAWTARRFYGGRYRIVPNGVHVPARAPGERVERDTETLRIVFVGQAVERKGLPVLLRAFEALREHVPATLTIVGAGSEEVSHMVLDDRGVCALGKVSEERKEAELACADVVCAPSLHGESFGMVLTEAFAAGVPVVASDIPGYRDVLRDGVDGVLVPPGDPIALAHELRRLALAPGLRTQMASAARERAERYAWPHVAREVLDTYEQALGVPAPASSIRRSAVRLGLAPADMRPRIPAERLPSLRGSGPRRARATPGPRLPRGVRALAVAAVLVGLAALARHALEGSGLDRLAASVLASKPGLLAAGSGLMCAAMLARALAWHSILLSVPTWRPARRRDAMQGTFIGVLMSATLPARLGEPSRALIVARRIGRARETLPLVLGTMVAQTLLNLLALAVIGASVFSGVDLLDGHHGVLVAATLAPVAALLAALVWLGLSPLGGVSAGARRDALRTAARSALARLGDGLRLFAHVRRVTVAAAGQLAAWGLQLMSCWLLLRALGLEGQTGVAGAAAVLFAVNATSVVPVTPGNVGLFQAACAVVLAGAYHVSVPEAIAYGLVLQAVETATALVMGLPALVNEGLSWREVRLRTLHAAPVRLGPLPAGAAALAARAVER
jgi:phosphatidylinositol alpha-mannosyltransferase